MYKGPKREETVAVIPGILRSGKLFAKRLKKSAKYITGSIPKRCGGREVGCFFFSSKLWIMNAISETLDYQS